MVRKDLRARRSPPLELLWDGYTFTVQPPTAHRGELLAKGIAWGISAVQNPDAATQDRMVAELGEDYFAELGGQYAIEQLSLGTDVWQQMFDAGLPLSDIQMLARYAAFFWVFGEAAADALGDPNAPAAAIPKPSPNGPATASASPSRTAPTAATTSPKRSAASSGKTPKAAARSRGSKSSTTGT